MTRATAEQIINHKRGHDEVVLDDGSTVLVRGLAHNEAHALQEIEDARERDVFMLTTALLEPQMTEAQVHAWFALEGATGELLRVAEKITTLSGRQQGQGKDATKSVPRRRGRR